MPSTSDWVAWRVAVPAALGEAAVGFLLSVSPQGLEDHGQEAGRRRLTVYLPAASWAAHGEAWRSRLRHLAEGCDAGISDELERRREKDWWALSRRFFHALDVGQCLRIRPPWAAPAPAGDRRELVIEPGRSFGTGHHDTTRLALELLEAQLAPGERVLDLGSGTGVLALAAAALGAGGVLALDVDPHAVRAARENAAANGLADRVTVAQGTLPLDPAGGLTPPPPYDLVVANIIRQVLEPLGPEFRRVLAPRGRLVVAGLLGSGAEAVADRYREAGLDLVERRRAGEWVALVFRAAGVKVAPGRQGRERRGGGSRG